EQIAARKGLPSRGQVSASHRSYKDTRRAKGAKGQRIMMRQDRFTEQAQQVLQASQEMVRQHRHPQWDVEHVFLALLSHKDGLARQIFQRLNVPVENVIERVARHLGQSPKLGYDVMQIYTTPRVV